MSAQGSAGPRAMDDSAFDSKLQELLKAWSSNVSVDGVVDAFEQRMTKTNHGQEQNYMRCMSMKTPPCVTSNSRVRLMYGVTCWCEENSEKAVFNRSADDQH